MVEWMHQILYNMISTNYLNTKAFDYIDPRGENIAYISWEIRAYYKSTLKSTPVLFFPAETWYSTLRQSFIGEL